MQHQPIYHPSFTAEQIDLWTRTIKSIESEAFDFNMEHWANDCGTPSCIGGHAEFCINQSPGTMPDRKLNAMLGITEEEGDKLFYQLDRMPFSSYRAVPRAYAIAVVRHFLTTREVRWDLGDI